MKPVIVVHGGAGVKRREHEIMRPAAEAGHRVLLEGGSAVDAVIESVVAMEDDPQFNAGTGSYMDLEGGISMDASVMTSLGGIGAVAALSSVKNPVLVARKVMESPHVLLVGEGALRFARSCGFREYDPSTEKARTKLAEAREKLRKGDVPGWTREWSAHLGGDTVGAVAMDSTGEFACASSTGGTSTKLPGRVGDTPIVGSGFYAGPYGAVVCTGIGEEIMRGMLARSTYDLLAIGESSQGACERLALRHPDTIHVGIIAVSRSGWGAATNVEMAFRGMNAHSENAKNEP